MDRLILSLNAMESTTQKIAKLSITSILVGTSRVRDFANIRALPGDLKQLKKLKQRTCLAEYFANYDKDGNLKMHGFEKQVKATRNAAQVKLGLVEMKLWTLAELTYFAKQLDMCIVKSNGRNAVLADYARALHSLHTQERRKLMARGQRKLKQEHAKWKMKLEKKGWKKVSPEQLRTFAKCMGLKPTEWRSTITLNRVMKTLFDTRPKGKRKSSQRMKRVKKKRRLNE